MTDRPTTNTKTDKWWSGCPEHGKNALPSGSCHECAMLQPAPEEGAEMTDETRKPLPEQPNEVVYSTDDLLAVWRDEEGQWWVADADSYDCGDQISAEEAERTINEPANEEEGQNDPTDDKTDDRRDT